MLTSTWRHWLQRLSRPTPRGRWRARTSGATHFWRPSLERLEERTTPTVTIAPTNNGGLGYAGLDFNQSGGYTPPDTCGAAGPTNYVETVNQTVAIYNPKATGSSKVTDSFSHFWYTVGGLPKTDSGSFLSDPIVTYDELIGRYIVGDQDVDFNTDHSNFDVAVSKTSNPASLTTADWNFYQISTSQSGFDADYPGNFGYNADAFVFTLNMFGDVSGGHTQVVSVNAADLAAGVSQSQLHTYSNNVNDFSLRPTTMHGSATGDPMWLVTEHGDNVSIDVIKMTGVLSNSAVFTYTNLAVTPYSQIVNPLNPNGTVITNNIDSRILKSSESNNTLVATHSVSVSSTQDVAQWYKVDLSGAAPALADQGRVSAGANTYVYYPGIDINPSGDIGMSFMRSGTDTSTDYMSVWVTGRTSTDGAGTMQAPVLVPDGAGQANYHDFSSGGRAGDLSGINVDPSDGSFWAANEFANTEATANWGTAIVNFTLGASTPASADLAVTASGPNTGLEGNNLTYTLTVTNNGPDAAPGVVLTDTLDPNLKFVSATTGQGTFSQSGGVVTFSVGTVAVGQTVTATVTAQALEDGNLTNSASASSSASDPNPGNNNAATSTGVTEAPIVVSGAITVKGKKVNNATVATFTHANGVEPASAFVATINWGDGTTSLGTVTQSGTTYSVKGSHSYGGGNTHTITTTVMESGTAPNFVEPGTGPNGVIGGGASGSSGSGGPNAVRGGRASGLSGSGAELAFAAAPLWRSTVAAPPITIHGPQAGAATFASFAAAEARETAADRLFSLGVRGLGLGSAHVSAERWEGVNLFDSAIDRIFPLGN